MCGNINIVRENLNEGEAYSNNIVMAFFDELFYFLWHVRKVYSQTGNMYLTIADKQINIKADNSAEVLIHLFVDFYKDEKRERLEIVSEELDSKKPDYFLVYKKKSGLNFDISTDFKMDIDEIKSAAEELDCTFIDVVLRDKMKEKLSELCKLLREADGCWGKKQIFRYLNLYYEVLGLFIFDESVLQTDGIVEKVLIPLLNLGNRWDETGETGKVTLSAPAVLAAWNLIYDRAAEYVLLPLHQTEEEGKGRDTQEQVEEFLHRDIFGAKIHQIFRYYIIREKGGELYNAALPAYTRTRKEKMTIPVKRLSTYDSYQGIRELRLGEKILYELALRAENIADKKDRIIIIGDSGEESLKELIRYVGKAIRMKTEYQHVRDRNITFLVYTSKTKKICTGVAEGYGYHIEPYRDFLKSPKALDQVLEGSDILFLLDNCQLYDLRVEGLDDPISFKQSISSELYESFYTDNAYEDLTLECKFMELYNVLTAYCWKGILGFFKKEAKESTIKYIWKYVKGSSCKTVYIYVSDISAFKWMACIQEQFVRIEKYNQKEIGIIRFTTQPKECLPNQAGIVAQRAGRHILVFNMWQVVKHILLLHKDEIENLFIHDPTLFLDEIFIGFDYTDWRNEVKVYYQFQKSGNTAPPDGFDAENITAAVKLLLKMLTYEKRPNMYQRYLKSAFVSFLYGAAKSVEDLVFLHIFSKQLRQLGSYRFCGFDPELSEHYNLNCKYSYKKNYWEAMGLLDSEVVTYLDRSRVISRVKKENISGFLTNILESCRAIHYQESKLYKNCEEMRDSVSI